MEHFENSIEETVYFLNLEMSKRLQLERIKLRDTESVKFEELKKNIQDLIRNIKLAEVPTRLLKLSYRVLTCV